MSAVNHQNNFATNLSSNQIAGVTTTPLNSIPSIDAPFYLALDATNVNSKYEVVLCTSKTATNVNHAATTYAHTTAEEVRMVIPAAEMDTLGSVPEGYMLNGKIVPSVGSNNLTVALKTLAGTDPTPADPVWVRIGDTVRAVTAALSVTKAAGTNWCNAGSAELATKEIDYFVYLGYNATDGVVIGFSRIPSANSYDDFSATSTNEKYCGISTITNAAATDYYEVVGRFAATLSAGAGYTWTVPTFTAKNLIQRPIFETRLLAFAPVWTGYSANPAGTNYYRIVGNRMILEMNHIDNLGTSNATTNNFTAPFAPKYLNSRANLQGFGWNNSAAITATTPRIDWAAGTNLYTAYIDGAGNAWTNSGTKAISVLGLQVEI